ncbi:DUF6199 family natural product biosynthesis protein [Paenibacillus sp. FSL P2-0136]|uniref:DUF6199 family natural product biosynthesis protein n=1 Tax=unclassified Paenibacillus TaxID=185978 RepID=UPI0030D858E0
MKLTKELIIIGTFAGIFFLLFGIAINLFALYVRRHPTFTWQMSEGWKTKGDSEPSDAYISSMRFRGAVGLWMGSFVMVMGILTIWSALG